MIKSSSKYFILRHGKLSLPFKDHSEMPVSVLSELGSGKLNPPIDREYSMTLVKKIIFDFPKILSTKIIYTSFIPKRTKKKS